MYLIVGLGNIGTKYELTRHNVGFLCLDMLADQTSLSFNKEKFDGDYAKGIIENKKVILLKPRTYMNLSGKSVVKYMDYFDIPASNVFVVYDDVDLDVGVLRIRKFGSAGTHNGMKSIINEIDDKNFPRFRIGVGKDERMDLANYVLSRFSDSDMEKIEETLKLTCEAIKESLKEDVDKAMNKYNKKTPLTLKEE